MAPAAVDHGSLGGALPGGDVFIEGTTGEEVHSASVVQSPVNLRWMMAGGLGLVLLLVGLTQWPKGEPPAPAAAADVALADQAENASDEDDTADGDSEHDPADAANGGPADADADDTGSTVADDPSTDDDQADSDDRRSSGAAGETTEDEVSVGVGLPLVGEQTGLGVIYGSQGLGRLHLLELDTGIVHELQATGDPLGIVGSTLITRRSESVSLYPLDSTNAEPTRISGQNGWVELIAITDDRIWAFDGNPEPDGWIVVGYDETGAEVEEVDIPIVFPFYGWDPSTEFVQGQAGGIYRRQGDSFQRVSLGLLVAAGDDLILARECNDRMDCALNWYARDDWDRPLDLPAPAAPVQGRVDVAGNDRWLIVNNWVNGSTELYDVQTGELVRTISSFSGSIENSIGLSPDGRWLIDPGFGSSMIIDLESGREWPQDIRGEVAVFVDLSVVGFSS